LELHYPYQQLLPFYFSAETRKASVGGSMKNLLGKFYRKNKNLPHLDVQ